MRTGAWPLSSSAVRNLGVVLYFVRMKTRPLTYSLKLEEHEDGYLAFFPALPGCHTWGRTYEEQIKHAEEALTLYLEALAELGNPIPEEHTNAPVSLGITVRTPIIA